MLKVQNLTKMYAGAAKPSVDGASFEVKGGEIFGFIGPNGAGKSTTIKCIAGIISITEGDVLIDGKSMRSDPIAAKKNIGYVSDDHALYEGLTGVEYVNFVADVFNVDAAEREQRLKRLTSMFALEESISKQISTYSHGMKQKLNIIGALIHEPKVWILDEPMTGLDPRSAYNLKQLMREHADKGNCVFFSSHVLEVVEKVCDRVGIIDDGHLITVCTMDELKQRNMDKSLEELFLKLTDDEFSSKLYSGEVDVRDAVREDKQAEDAATRADMTNEEQVEAGERATSEQKLTEDGGEAGRDTQEHGDKTVDDAKETDRKVVNDQQKNDEKYSKNQSKLEYSDKNNDDNGSED